MLDLVYNEKEKNLQRCLAPMFHILEEKNILDGVSYIDEQGKLYILFDKNYLSYNNQLILEKIAGVYSETFFYSNNFENPMLDRLEYWCPDEYYDKRTHITEKCRNKKYIVLELDLNDSFIVLGTSIMISNVLLEQDPLSLKCNEGLTIFNSDIIDRHEHYITSGCPDLMWINLCISLNADNPLRKNPYAPLANVCEINSPVECDNVILSTLIGYNEKKYISFCMDKDELKKAVGDYFGVKNKKESETKRLLFNKKLDK